MQREGEGQRTETAFHGQCLLLAAGNCPTLFSGPSSIRPAVADILGKVAFYAAGYDPTECVVSVRRDANARYRLTRRD